jgi:Protein of unknown function (DUF4231)
MDRPALIRRLPTLRAPRESEPVLPPGTAANDAELKDDLAALEQELAPEFSELDLAALRSQHGFRLGQVLLIFGGLVATVLGAVQAALHHAAWAGIAEAVILAVLGAVFRLVGDLNFKENYLDPRLKAERLRAEFFFFLARTGQYGKLDPDAARRLLRQRSIKIKAGQNVDG